MEDLEDRSELERLRQQREWELQSHHDACERILYGMITGTPVDTSKSTPQGKRRLYYNWPIGEVASEGYKEYQLALQNADAKVDQEILEYRARRRATSVMWLANLAKQGNVSRGT